MDTLGIKKDNIQELNVAQVRDLVRNSTSKDLLVLLELIKLDSRKGVRALETTIHRRIKKEEEKRQKKVMLLQEENKLWYKGYEQVGGLDEAGRGPLAGPVVAACVVFKPNTYIDGIDDSKKLTPAKREEYFNIIMEKAHAVGIGRVDSREIDRINILRATRLAMEEAASKCYPNMDFLLIDAMDGKFPVPYISLVKGDACSHSIAAASIIAKVTRDREMMNWHKKYPEYGFDSHKGYGTSKHMEAIRKMGLCPIHRKTFIQGI